MRYCQKLKIITTMSTQLIPQKKYIIYDHHLEYLREIIIRHGDQINKEVNDILNRSVLFLQYENTYYYRDTYFLKVG
jgi:hypothetical protein